jgi:hypothetical protein
MTIDGCRNSMDFFQSRGLTASSMRGDYADVSGAKLSGPPLLHGVRQHGDQHPSMRLLLLRMWRGERSSCLQLIAVVTEAEETGGG